MMNNDSCNDKFLSKIAASSRQMNFRVFGLPDILDVQCTSTFNGDNFCRIKNITAENKPMADMKSACVS